MRKTTLTLILSFLISFFAFSQRNVAPMAIVTAQGRLPTQPCNTGPANCAKLNDLSFGVCGTNEVNMVTNSPPDSTDYIQWDFPTPQTFDSLIIHNGNSNARIMNGATIEYWDGSSWIFHSSFSNLPSQCVHRVGIGKLKAQRFRMTKIKMDMSVANNNPGFREIEILEASDGHNNAGVVEVYPEFMCSGAQRVQAKIRNLGLNTIDSVNVHWEVNGMYQGSLSVYAKLEPMGSNLSSDTIINLGNYNFTSNAALKVYTDLPNGVPDTLNDNDTLRKAVQISMGGQYTVDRTHPAGGTNFHSIGDAMTALKTLGVCSRVYLQVYNGVYNEDVLIEKIPGVSEINNVLITSKDSSQTIISGQSSYGVVTFNNAKHVHLNGFTIHKNRAGIGILFVGTSEYDTLSSCAIQKQPSVTAASYGVAFSNSLTSLTVPATSKILVEKNSINSFDHGVYYTGNSSVRPFQNEFYDNIIDSGKTSGFYVSYQDSLILKRNKVNMLLSSSTSAPAFNGTGGMGNVVMEQNYFWGRGNGVYLNSTNTIPFYKANKLVNNMIYSESGYGLYMSFADSAYLWHNSIHVEGGQPAAYLLATNPQINNSYDVRNNIFSGGTNNSYAFRTSYNIPAFSHLDYNIYTTQGTNLLNIANVNYVDLPAYRQVDSLLLNRKSIEAVPGFISSTDLHILGVTPFDAGDNAVGVTIDIDGDTRPGPLATNVSIGADEFTPALCNPPRNLRSEQITFSSAVFKWDSIPSGASVEYVLVPCGQSANSGAAIVTSIDSVQISNLAADGCYTLFARTVCGRGDSSIWVSTQILTGYCVPQFNFQTSSTYVDDFYTANALQNINNRSTGYSSNGYNNSKHIVLEHFAGGDFDFFANIVGGTAGFTVWIDWNQDLMFDDTTEKVYTSNSYSNGPFSSTINIPSGVAQGTYVMRIVVDNTSSPSDPCYGSRGEYEDYTIEIVPRPTCLTPTSLQGTDIATDSMTISWQAAHTGSNFEYVLIPCGAAFSSGTIVGTQSDSLRIGGVLADSCYQLYVRQICSSSDTSAWAGPQRIKTGYCVPSSMYSSSSSSTYIDDFITQNALQNISNTASGYTRGAYLDARSQVIRHYATGTFDFTANVKGGNYGGFAIWIDWDKDLVFDEPADRVYRANTLNTYRSSITIPAGTPNGTYTMRIATDETNYPTDPCFVEFDGEFEDYTIEVINKPTCLPPIDLNPRMTAWDSLNISWKSANNGSNFQYVFQSCGDSLQNGTVVNTSMDSVSFGGIYRDSCYQIFIREICGIGDTSLWAGPYSVPTGPCIPTFSSTIVTTYIDAFSTSKAILNISNLRSGRGTNGYQNSKSMVVMQSANNTFDFSVDIQATGTVGCAIWVDWNDDFTFDNSEREFSTTSFGNGPFTGTITIPPGTPEGDYVLRVGIDFNSSQPDDPCFGTRGEFEDYTLRVTRAQSCLLSDSLYVVTTTNTTAEIGWNERNLASNWQVEYGKKGFAIGTGNRINTTTQDTVLTGLESERTYEFYVRSICAVGDTSLWAGPLSFNTKASTYYPIGIINTVNAQGVMDSLYKDVWTSGTMVGVNLSGSGDWDFTIIDQSSNSQEGIRVRGKSLAMNSSFTEGDSLKVKGKVVQDKGLGVLRADSIAIISSGHSIPNPRLVSTLNEATESNFIEIQDFILLDSSSIGTYTMRAFNGNDTLIIRVEAQTDVSDSLSLIHNALIAGDTLCLLLGVGGQEDATSPYTEGYYVSPMYYEDLRICKSTAVGLNSKIYSNNSISIFPNPNKGSFTITTKGLSTDNAILTIRDISGKIIVKENIVNSSSAFKRDYSMEGQAKGLYFISILDGKHVINKKLIIQ